MPTLLMPTHAEWAPHELGIGTACTLKWSPSSGHPGRGLLSRVESESDEEKREPEVVDGLTHYISDALMY